MTSNRHMTYTHHLSHPTSQKQHHNSLHFSPSTPNPVKNTPKTLQTHPETLKASRYLKLRPATMQGPQKVYILLHASPSAGLTTTILGVFVSLQDANDECFSQARKEAVTLESESSTMGPTREFIAPVQPARWDTAEGTSCWVEGFDVTPKRIASPS